jgi:hypothetical protein
MEYGTKKLNIDKPCYICGQPLQKTNLWMFPFDECQSLLTAELGFPIHVMVAHHQKGEYCLCIQDSDSSTAVDYHSCERRRIREENRKLRINCVYEL